MNTINLTPNVSIQTNNMFQAALQAYNDALTHFNKTAGNLEETDPALFASVESYYLSTVHTLTSVIDTYVAQQIAATLQARSLRSLSIPLLVDLIQDEAFLQALRSYREERENWRNAEKAADKKALSAAARQAHTQEALAWYEDYECRLSKTVQEFVQRLVEAY